MQEKIIQYEEESEKRVDVFLHQLYSNKFSRAKIQEKIEKNLVSINGKDIKKNQILELNDEILIKPEFFETQRQDLSNIAKFDFDIEIVYEDKHLAVINKPAGISVHPSNQYQSNTLVNALVAKLGKDSLSDLGGIERLGIVHRLDKETSGLMVIAKNNKAHELLSQQIADKEDFHREYIALCYGVPVPSTGNIELFMKKGSYADGRMIIATQNEEKAKFSSTYYEVIKTFQNGMASMIKCKLSTGRTHQIRLHMSSLGHSIIGDKVYTSNNCNKYISALRFLEIKPQIHMLMSKKLSFIHPITGKEISYEVEINEQMQEVVDILSSAITK